MQMGATIPGVIATVLVWLQHSVNSSPGPQPLPQCSSLYFGSLKTYIGTLGVLSTKPRKLLKPSSVNVAANM